MTLFTKPINDIVYDDVISFCQQGLGEGINLDYKKDFPQNEGLEKTIAAFANTSGGIIIIGVEDKDSKPKLPFEGIEFRDKLEERVWQIILANIYPPVLPEIRICPQKENKTFIVIRVAQSNETPHALFNNTSTFIRTGNINKPEELATMEQIEWLKIRRKKSEDLRESLHARAEERYQNICESKKAKIEFGELTLSISPLYPQKPLFTVEEIEDLLANIKVTNRNSSEFPPPQTLMNLQPVQDGMGGFYFQKSSNFVMHLEVNKFGLVFYKLDIGQEEINKEKTVKQVYISWILSVLSLALRAVFKLYKKVGFWGLVQVAVSVDKILGIRVTLSPSDYGREYYQENHSDKQLSWEFVFSVSQFDDSSFLKNKLVEFGKDVAWSLGFKTNENTIEQYLGQIP